MSHKLSSQDYQALARTCYKLEQYKEALELLTQGLEVLPGLALLDYRAACFSKLGDFSAAVRDGREMIKLDRADIKGYLRTASVLEKMEMFDTALGIYKYGMKNIPVGDENFMLLQKLHDKLTRKLSPPRAVDPFTVLPIELIEMIFRYLSFKNMINCMRISRSWRDFLVNSPNLWLHLDLSGACRSVSRSFVAQAVRRSKSRLTCATIHRFDHMDVLKNIAKACKNLAELTIITLPFVASASLLEIVQSAAKLRKLVIHPELTMDTAVQILHRRPDLEHVTYRGIAKPHRQPEWKSSFPGLNSFRAELEEDPTFDSHQLGNLLQNTPALEHLTLNRFEVMWLGPPSALPPLRTIILRKTRFNQFNMLPRTVRRLHVEHARTAAWFGSDGQLTTSCLPELTDLRLWGFSWLNPESMGHFLDCRPQDDDDDNMSGTVPITEAKPLEFLSIRGIIRDSDDGIPCDAVTLLQGSSRTLTPALRTLDIAGLSCSDDDIENLLTSDLALHSLDLSGTHVTGASIKMLADKLPSLKSVRVNSCMRINGRDAIHYAQRRGVSIAHSLAESRKEHRIVSRYIARMPIL